MSYLVMKLARFGITNKLISTPLPSSSVLGTRR